MRYQRRAEAQRDRVCIEQVKERAMEPYLSVRQRAAAAVEGDARASRRESHGAE